MQRAGASEQTCCWVLPCVSDEQAFSVKGQRVNEYQLYRPQALCHNDSALMLQRGRQYLEKRAGPSTRETLFIDTEIWISIILHVTKYSTFWRCGTYMKAWKSNLLSLVWLSATPWTVAFQALLSVEFSRQECSSGLPCPSPGDDPPDPGIEPKSLTLQADSLPSEPPGKPKNKVIWLSH